MSRMVPSSSPVRTEPSQGLNTGSNPVGTTKPSLLVPCAISPLMRTDKLLENTFLIRLAWREPLPAAIREILNIPFSLSLVLRFSPMFTGHCP